MHVLKQIFNFYINSSIHVALAIVSLSYITFIEFNIRNDYPFLWFIFYASITGYNFVKFFGTVKFHNRPLIGWLKLIYFFSILSFVLMCYYAHHLQTNTLLYIAAFGAVTFFYAIPMWPKRFFLDSHYNLRSVSGLKVYVIALVWCGVTVLIPLINYDYNFNVNVVLTAFQRFIFIVVLMLPFEIRDLQFDNSKLSTIPQKIGVMPTKIMGFLLLIIFFFLEFFKDDIDGARVTILLIITCITLLLLAFSKKDQGMYYSSFWVEGLPILWLVIFLIFT